MLRYNTYPLIPHWNRQENPPQKEWVHACKNALSKKEAKLSLYIHIPFCEKLCSFCACNTFISQNHNLESEYVQSMQQEFNLYKQLLPELEKANLGQLYLGGGTPNYLSASNLGILIKPILQSITLENKNTEFSAEIDIRHLKKEHLQVLHNLGFRQLRFGVEDMNYEVQHTINRSQSFELLEYSCQTARGMGYNILHFDLLYGLPQQTKATLKKSMEQVLSLKPERISFYHYRHVPWFPSNQRLFNENDLPSQSYNEELYFIGQECMQQMGYHKLGMDYYTLADDPLQKAREHDRLKYNFMGYHQQNYDLLLGLGCSAISETEDYVSQNNKILNVYQKQISQGKLALLRAHKRNKSEQARHQIIREFIATGCHATIQSDFFHSEILPQIKTLLESGLAEYHAPILNFKPHNSDDFTKLFMALDEHI